MSAIEIIKLSDKNDKIDYFYHISDIHINLQKRHLEFREVFNRLYIQLNAFKSSQEKGLIILTGDILNSKNIMTPELIVMVQEFFSQLSEIYPVILIAGNHDAILTNSDRMDSLTPLVFSQSQPHKKLTAYESDKYKNLYYLRESGLYKYNSIIFSVASVFDSKVIPANDIKISPGELRVALHHGTLDGSKTDLGHTLTSALTITDFKYYDAVLLGDIHKYQSLDADQKIKYAGSLIQLNHGESINNHGLLKWNLTKHDQITTKFYEIPNDYGFCTITIRKNEIVKQPHKIPSKPRIRYRIDQLTSDQKFAEIKQQFRLKYQIQEEIVDNLSIWGEPLTNENQVDDEKLTINETDQVPQLVIDILNPEIQKQLIVDYFKDQQLDDKMIEKLCQLNTLMADELSNQNQNSESDIIHNSNGQMRWKIKKLTFDNMFSYGSNNTIDFIQFNQICGIFGENAIGKSSILDIILFVLFDKCSRGDRTEILNLRKDTFCCELLFSIGNNNYKIQRKGSKYSKTVSGKKRTTVRIDVIFEQILNDGNSLNLSGQDRNETNKKIREMIGTYDDFLMSTFLLQKGNDKFLKMSQIDQKTRLYDLFKLNWFEKLYSLAKSKLDYYTHKIKDLEKLQINIQLVQQQNELSNINLQLDPINSDILETEKILQLIEQEIIDTKTNILPLQETDLSEELINDELAQFTLKINRTRAEIENLQLLIATAKEHYNFCLIQDNDNEIEQLEKEIKCKESDINIISSQIYRLKDYINDNYDNEHQNYDGNIKKLTVSIENNELNASQLTERLEALQLKISKNKNLVNLNKKKEDLMGKLELANNKIKQLYESKKFIKNGQSNPTVLNNQLDQANLDYSKLALISKQFEEQLQGAIETLNHLSAIDLPIYNQSIKERKIKEKKINEIQSKIQNIELSSQKLLELKYDEKCNYCMNNIFVIEAKQCALELDNYKLQSQKIMTELDNLNDLINQMQTPDQIKLINEKITSLNYEEAINHKEINSMKREIDEINREIFNYHFNTSVEVEINQLSNDLNKIRNELEELSHIIEQKNKVNEEISLLKEQISICLIDKLNLQKEKENIEKFLIILENNHDNHLSNLKNLDKIEELKSNLVPLRSRLQICKGMKNSFIEYEKNLLKTEGYEKEIEISQRKINDLTNKLMIYKKNIDTKILNLEFESKLKNLQLEKGRCGVKLYNLTKRKEETIIKRTVLETTISNLQIQVNELVQLKVDYEIYQLYCQCLGKNGLPHNLLMKIINRVSEISNNILQQIADFTIQFVEDSDRKKLSVLLHRQGLTQSTDLTSGFEEFIIELSLKIAFSLISNVTRPNFLAIDEGFGCLDSDHLSSLTSVLNFIKTKFDFILIITHVNELKGQGDYYIDITKLKNGDSLVNNSKITAPNRKLPILKLKYTKKN